MKTFNLIEFILNNKLIKISFVALSILVLYKLGENIGEAAYYIMN